MILTVIGSGRETGNCATLAAEALRAAQPRSRGSTVTHHLSRLSFQGCTGCGSCRGTADACVLSDDLTPVLEQTASCAALILAAPIYYGYPSGLFKSYLDRWYSFRDASRTLRTTSGRACLLILAQGHGDPDAYAWTRDSLSRVLDAYGFRPTVLVASGLEAAGAAADNQDLLARVRVAAGNLTPDETQE